MLGIVISYSPQVPEATYSRRICWERRSRLEGRFALMIFELETCWPHRWWCWSEGSPTHDKPVQLKKCWDFTRFKPPFGVTLQILESIFSPKTNDAHSHWQQSRPLPLPLLLAQRWLAEEQPQQQANERFIREEMLLLREPKNLSKTYVAWWQA